ncbi:proline-rich protein 14 isoform X2 [Oryctolagus cuniculus]|uniref:proline-rich protein 14 isoform X2 n=1 Tax=Oryctolagus cuniculus TaxID=9986 RepID=UPI0038791BE6
MNSDFLQHPHVRGRLPAPGLRHRRRSTASPSAGVTAVSGRHRLTFPTAGSAGVESALEAPPPRHRLGLRHRARAKPPPAPVLRRGGCRTRKAAWSPGAGTRVGVGPPCGTGAGPAAASRRRTEPAPLRGGTSEKHPIASGPVKSGNMAGAACSSGTPENRCVCLLGTTGS